MIVRVFVAGIACSALIDTGATVSAVSHRFLERHHHVPELKPEHHSGISVTVADNRSCQSLSSLPSAPITLTDGVSHNSSLITLPLPSGIDLSLGTDWLNAHRASIHFNGAAAATIFVGSSNMSAGADSSRHSLPTPALHRPCIASVSTKTGPCSPSNSVRLSPPAVGVLSPTTPAPSSPSPHPQRPPPSASRTPPWPPLLPTSLQHTQRSSLSPPASQTDQEWCRCGST